jgi:twitching motility two-component system response regulator PilH
MTDPVAERRRRMAKKILIVDDEPDVRTFLETLLREEGYETKTAVDGNEAEKIVASFKPDLITLDIIMPKETGVKFYRFLTKDKALSGVPVIILSGVTRFKDLFGRDHAAMPKPFAFVEKPIEKDELLQKIADAIAGKPAAKA